MATTLIVTRSDDNDSVAMVTEALERQGARAVLLNTDLYPDQVRISTRLDQRGDIRTLTDEHGRRFDLSDVSSLWYRRFNAGGSLPDALGDTRDACLKETRETLYGAIASLDCFQLDPVKYVRGADHKELQLQRARAHGLAVPETLITNDSI